MLAASECLLNRRLELVHAAPVLGGNCDNTASGRDQIGIAAPIRLVAHENLRNLSGIQLGDDLIHRLRLLAPVVARDIHHVEQNIRVRQLLQRRLERGHQMVRQLADKSDRVGQQNLLRVRDAQFARRRVERVKQPVIGLNPRAGQRIEQCGFSRVGISHNRHQRQFRLFALSTLNRPHLTDGFQIASQFVNAPSDVTAVALELGLTRSARADAAALTGQHLAHAGKPRENVLILRQLHLQFALAGAGALSENIQNQCAPVEHRPSGHLLQHTHLGR